jgi:hypothetical protein
MMSGVDVVAGQGLVNSVEHVSYRRLVTALFLVQVGCGPWVAVRANMAEALVACSVSQDTPVTADQAKCLARANGLERGVRPWKVESERDRADNEAVWAV